MIQFLKLNALDIKGKLKLGINIKKSEPACVHCLPTKPLKNHKYLFGMPVHERIDCPKDTLYLINEKKFRARWVSTLCKT
jgi:hypothetical protein